MVRRTRPGSYGKISDRVRAGLPIGLTLFGLFAVTAMLLCYALEDRNHLFVLAFAASCALGSIYGFLQGAWPFGLVEAIWAGVALRRWMHQVSAFNRITRPLVAC